MDKSMREAIDAQKRESRTYQHNPASVFPVKRRVHGSEECENIFIISRTLKKRFDDSRGRWYTEGMEYDPATQGIRRATKCVFLRGNYVLTCGACGEVYVPSAFELEEYCKNIRFKVCPLYMHSPGPVPAKGDASGFHRTGGLPG
jgi:hypothetical protein